MKTYISPDTLYKLGKPYKPRDYQAVTWVKVSACIDRRGGAAKFDALVTAAQKHVNGARGFILYLIRRGYLAMANELQEKPV